MPAISMFYGIIIYMYMRDHLPPHFHARYQGFEAIFDFEGEMLEGEMPRNQAKLISAWATVHRDELEANWILAKEKQPLFKINPLQ